MEQVVVLLRALLRRALNERRSETPALTDINIERAHGRLGPRLGAQFANGHRAWTAVRASDCYDFCERHSAWDLESLRRALLHEAHQIYPQMLDDHIVEFGLCRRREQLEQLRRNAVNGPLAEQLRRQAYELEQQIRRHNRARAADQVQTAIGSPLRHRDLPPRLRDWWARRWNHFSRSAVTRPATFDYAPVEAANDRGLQLLKQNLCPSQCQQYDKYRYFDVIGGETGKRYRIRHGCQMNVDELDKKGRCVSRLCFMPKGRLVAGDVMLAQKIALELFESDAIKVANKFAVGFSMMGSAFDAPTARWG